VTSAFALGMTSHRWKSRDPSAPHVTMLLFLKNRNAEKDSAIDEELVLVLQSYLEDVLEFLSS